MARVPRSLRDEPTDIDRVKSKTVVTSINRSTEPAPIKEACLVVIYGSELGRKYSLESPSVVLGRSKKCDIQIDQDSVSREHSKIINSGRSVRIRDLGSTNGTYVNDELAEERTLADGDLIKTGRTIFKFLSGGNIERAYHEELYRLTSTDGLTQLRNKRSWIEALVREVRRTNARDGELSVIFLDIDHFKHTNDTHGHLAGDRVLKDLASVIKTSLPNTEGLVARYDADQFAIVLPDVPLSSASQSAETIRRLVAKTAFEVDGVKIPVTISAGVVGLREGIRDSTALVGLAQECLQAAKNAGRDRVVRSSQMSMPRETRQPRAYPLPDLRLRERLAEKRYVSCFAAAVLQRRRFAAIEGGVAILAELDKAFASAIAQAISKRDVLGVLQDGCTLVVGLADASLDAAVALADKIEDDLFERERVKRGLAHARVVCGRPILLAAASTATGHKRRAAISLAISEAAEVLTRRQAEAERGELLPLPIADALRRLGSQTHPTNAFNALTTLVETVSRWLLTLAVGEAIAAGGETMLAAQSLLGSSLVKPVSDGRWIEILREACKLLQEAPSAPRRIGPLLAAMEREDLVPTLEKFVAARNKFTHSMDKADPECARAIVEEFAPGLEAIISAGLESLSQARPFQVHDTDVVDGEIGTVTYRYGLRWLLGDNAVIAPSNVVSRTVIKRGRVYAGEPGSDVAVMLDPLVLYERCPACEQHEMFFLDGVKDGQAVYKSLPRAHLVEAGRLEISGRRNALSWLVRTDDCHTTLFRP